MTVAKENFREKLVGYRNQYLCDIQDSDGNWTVKGFIDIFKNNNSEACLLLGLDENEVN